MMGHPISSLLTSIPSDLAERLAVVYQPNEWFVFSAARKGEPTLAATLAAGSDAAAGPKPPHGANRVCVKFARDGRLRAANRGGYKDWRDWPGPEVVVAMLGDIAGPAVGSSAPIAQPEPPPSSTSGGVATKALPAPSIGEVVGVHYTITRRLGTGGFGSAYEATFRLLPQRPRVLKFAHDTERAESLRREAEKALDLAHENVCRIIDIGEDPIHGLFLVMQHGGRSVADLCSSGPLSVAGAAAVVAQAAAGIDYLHDKGVVHGDINPGNVLVDENDRVRVTDFGLAATLVTTQATDGHETVMGSNLHGYHPVFSAPEILCDRGQRPSSDQYSLARVFCAMLQGYKGPPQKLDATFPELSSPQQQALLRALEMDPRSRFPSAVEFADALGASDAGSAVGGD